MNGPPRYPMLDWLVDELVQDVFREVLHELDVASVGQLANALLDSLDISRLSLQFLALLVEHTVALSWLGERNSSSLPLKGSVAMICLLA
jgi:hypothetical protein